MFNIQNTLDAQDILDSLSKLSSFAELQSLQTFVQERLKASDKNLLQIIPVLQDKIETTLDELGKSYIDNELSTQKYASLMYAVLKWRTEVLCAGNHDVFYHKALHKFWTQFSDYLVFRNTLNEIYKNIEASGKTNDDIRKALNGITADPKHLMFKNIETLVRIFWGWKESFPFFSKVFNTDDQKERFPYFLNYVIKYAYPGKENIEKRRKMYAILGYAHNCLSLEFMEEGKEEVIDKLIKNAEESDILKVLDENLVEEVKNQVGTVKDTILFEILIEFRAFLSLKLSKEISSEQFDPFFSKILKLTESDQKKTDSQKSTYIFTPLSKFFAILPALERGLSVMWDTSNNKITNTSLHIPSAPFINLISELMDKFPQQRDIFQYLGQYILQRDSAPQKETLLSYLDFLIETGYPAYQKKQDIVIDFAENASSSQNKSATEHIPLLPLPPKYKNSVSSYSVK